MGDLECVQHGGTGRYTGCGGPIGSCQGLPLCRRAGRPVGPHWPVVSAAATEITTRLFEETAGTDTPGRAEALRRSMLALMETADKPYYAHPLFWAPFVVVGEGAP